MAFNKKEQELIRWGIQNGKSPDEIKTAVANFRANISSETTPEVSVTQGLGERLSEDVTESLGRAQQAIKGEGEFEGRTPIRRGVEATAAASSIIPKAVFDLLPESARNILEKAGEAVSSGFEKVTEKIGETELFQKAAAGQLVAEPGGSFRMERPDIKATEEALGTAAAAGEVAGNLLAVEGGLRAGTKVVDVSGKGISAVGNTAKSLKDAGITLSKSEGIKQAVDLGLKPEDIMQRVARVSKAKQANFETRAGESVGDYLVSRNIFGTPDELVDQLYSRMQQSMSIVDRGLAKVDGTFKDTSLLRALRELSERETKVGGLGTKSPDTERINQLLKKHNGEGLTLSEANEVKRLYERNVKLDFLRDNVASGVEASNRVDNAMRDFIVTKAADNGFDTVTALNRETSLAKQLLDDIGAEYAGQAGNNAISLSDTIFLAEATGNPVAAAGFITKKVLSNKAVMAKLAEKLSKDAGSKAELPKATVSKDTNKLSGYLEFLKNQSNEASP